MKKTPSPAPEPEVQPGVSLPPRLDDVPMLQDSARAAGTLSADTPPDKTMATSSPAANPEQASGASVPASAEANTQTPQGTVSPPTVPPPPEPLRLPRGAFVAFRKSGGLKFTTRAIVLYPDGRVAYDERGALQKEYNQLRRVLNDAQVLALRKLLDQVGFWRAASAGKQNPDAYAYEIAARVGQRANSIEVFDKSLPEELAPLIERLAPLLPPEE